MARIPQLPAELHIEIFRGDAWEISCDFDLDLTGYTFAAQLHPKNGNAIALTVTEVNLANGQIKVILPAATSATLAAVLHSWCLTLTPPVVSPALPRPRKMLAGRFLVKDC